MIKYILITLLILFVSCEDPIPYDYLPENVLQAYLIVGNPIDDILLYKSQAINNTFNLEDAIIKDAKIKIKYSEFDLGKLDFVFKEEFTLEYNNDSTLKYKSSNGHIVQKLSKYDIEIILSDESKITATTVTPDSLIWSSRVDSIIQYPIDSISFTTSDDSLSWKAKSEYTTIQTNGYYHLQVRSLDTTEYGIYIDSIDSSEMNRRIERDFREDWAYNELSSNAYIPSTGTDVVWNAFKWYGLHEITIYSMDFNWSKALLQQLASSSYDPLLNAVEGNGIGTFASACAIRDTFFILKNQE
jgi:hypothetical protein